MYPRDYFHVHAFNPLFFVNTHRNGPRLVNSLLFRENGGGSEEKRRRRCVRTRDEGGLHRSRRVSEASVASIETKKLLPAGQIGERSRRCTRVPGKWRWCSNERRRLGTSSLIRKNVHRDVSRCKRAHYRAVHAINSALSWNLLIRPFFSSIVYRADVVMGKGIEKFIRLIVGI